MSEYVPEPVPDAVLGDTHAAPPRHVGGPRNRPLFWSGWALMVFGWTLTIMMVVNHFKEQPRQPLGLDLTLRWGYGGFIFYGVVILIVGLAMVLASHRSSRPGREP
jgi:hypothetical protein